MKTELLKHKLAYIILFVGLLLLLMLFLGSWPNKLAQRAVILTMSLFYAAWGCVTHVNAKTMTRGVALEYVAVAAFGGVILAALTV